MVWAREGEMGNTHLGVMIRKRMLCFCDSKHDFTSVLRERRMLLIFRHGTACSPFSDRFLVKRVCVLFFFREAARYVMGFDHDGAGGGGGSIVLL